MKAREVILMENSKKTMDKSLRSAKAEALYTPAPKSTAASQTHGTTAPSVWL